MNHEIQNIKDLFKQLLPPHELTYCEVDVHSILGLHFQTAGVAVKLETGLECYGSSSSFLRAPPLMFAAYECLERYAIHNQLSPPLEGKTFRNSLSNGVAIHQNFFEAKKAAYLELLERNEILKSWYFNTPIRHINLSAEYYFSAEMIDQYDLHFVDFSSIPDCFVVGIFALPKIPSLNPIYGFGSGLNESEGIFKARKEFLTRLGFLWGETPAYEDQLGDIRTPNFHQEFYLRHENLQHLRDWLQEDRKQKKNFNKYQVRDLNYENITPNAWGSKYPVIKATASDSIPLFFGLPTPELFDFNYRCDIPHPIV